MLTPAQVAKIANLHPNTVRNWTNDYADLLSPAARGEAGTRLFSDEDVEVLCAIAALRKSGVPPGDIAARVRDRQAPSVIDVTPTTPPQEATTGLQQADLGAWGIQVAYNSLQTEVGVLRGEVKALQRRLDAGDKAAIYQAERRGAWVALVVVGFLWLVMWLAVNGAPW